MSLRISTSDTIVYLEEDRYVFDNQKSVWIPLLCVIIILLSIGGYSLWHPTPPDYEIISKNVDETEKLGPGIQSFTLNIQNAGTSPLRGVIARPIYGDHSIFPDSFKIPDLENHGDSIDIDLPVNVPKKVNHWKAIYLFYVPVKNPIDQKQIYVLARLNPAVEISFDSDLNGGKKTSTATYNARRFPSPKPPDPYCVSDVGDNNIPDGTNVKSGGIVDKHWNVNVCGAKIPNLQGFALWANFDFNQPTFPISNPEDFGTTIQLPNDTGIIQIVYVLTSTVNLYGVDYLQPMGNSFWVLVVSK